MAAAGQRTHPVDDTHPLGDEGAALAQADTLGLAAPGGDGIRTAYLADQIDAPLFQRRLHRAQEARHGQHLRRGRGDTQGATGRAAATAVQGRFVLGLDHDVAYAHYVPSAVVNAFATGSKQEASIALTDGLLRSLRACEHLGKPRRRTTATRVVRA